MTDHWDTYNSGKGQIIVTGPGNTIYEPPITLEDTKNIRVLKPSEIAVLDALLIQWREAVNSGRGAIKHLAWAYRDQGWEGTIDALEVVIDQIDNLLRGRNEKH